MTTPGRSQVRRLLHPLTTSLGLLAAALAAGAVVLLEPRHLGTAAAGLLLVAVAGAAAGFANSGST